MIQYLQMAYTTYRWARLATSIILLIYAIALSALGGFPPLAWQLLFHTLPMLPKLWAVQGVALVLPLTGLVLLSLSLLALWGLLLAVAAKLALHWWQERQRRQAFAQEMQGGKQIAAQKMYRSAATTARGIQRSQPSVTLLTASNASRTLPPARNSANGQLTHARSSAVHAGTPALLSAGCQHKERYEHTGRLLSSARPSPVQSVPSSFYEQQPIMSHSDSKLDDAASGDDDVTLLAIPPYSKEAYQHKVPPRQQSNTVRLLIGAGSDPGLARKHAPNEDSILVLQETRSTGSKQFPAGLFVVADGMGGHADGQQASQLVIQSMRDTVLPALRNSEADEMTCADLLYVGVERANFTLYQHNQQRHAMMGTTMTAALVFGTRAYIVSVGDSRAYLYRPPQGLSQITNDHSIVAELVAARIIAPDDIYTHPRRNQVTRCLGDTAKVEIDSFIIPLQVGDLLMLCSDGLWEMVRDPDIEQLIASSPRDAEYLSKMLIQAALNRGGADNVSSIVVGVTEAT